MEHAFPIVRGVVRDLVDRARVGDVDADRRRGWSGQRKRIENSQGEIAAPRCLDHKLRVESGPLAVGIDILDAGDRASLIGDEPLDARALSDLDIDVSVQARSAVRPPMRAPMTMARCPMADIATSRVSR